MIGFATIKRTTEYACGCTVTTTRWDGVITASVLCLKHKKRVKKVTTVVEYHEQMPTEEPKSNENGG